MNIKHSSILFVTILLLTACSQIPQSTEVDRLSLLKSRAYIQHHLVNDLLENGHETGKKSDFHANRQKNLIQAYCDLAERAIVKLSDTPTYCDSAPLTQSICTAQFHRCIGKCSSLQPGCLQCEVKLEQCLNREETNPSAQKLNAWVE